MSYQDVDELPNGCKDCGGNDELAVVFADLGQGAFIAILCPTCWHRRQYLAELNKRRAAR